MCVCVCMCMSWSVSLSLCLRAWESVRLLVCESVCLRAYASVSVCVQDVATIKIAPESGRLKGNNPVSDFYPRKLSNIGRSKSRIYLL